VTELLVRRHRSGLTDDNDVFNQSIDPSIIHSENKKLSRGAI